MISERRYLAYESCPEKMNALLLYYKPVMRAPPAASYKQGKNQCCEAMLKNLAH